jgi:3-hydroxybutyryl-CoA dehydrogenase
MPHEGPSVAAAGVVGLGTMGAGIVEVFARAGIAVTGVDVTDDAVALGRAHLERSTSRAVSRGRLADVERAALLQRVRLSSDLEELADADIVVEAVPERLPLKQEVFARLDKVCGPDALLATNTSSLSVTRLAAGTQRPERVVGMHFFNPAPVMRLVEVVTTVVTDPAAARRARLLADGLGKTPVVVTDRAGFVANALLFGYLNQAVGLLATGHVGRDDLDAAMTLGAGLPMGPLALLDLVGLDVAVDILETMYAESGDRLHAADPLLRQLVAAGRLGRKTGRGFYGYGDEPEEQSPTPEADVSAVERIGVVGDSPAAAALAAVAQQQLGVSQGAAGSPRLAAELSGCGLLVGSVDDPLDVLGAAAPTGAVLALLAGSRALAAAAAATGRPGDVVGLHLPDPAAPRLVEVVRAVTSSPDAVDITVATMARLGLRPVVCADRAGRVVDRLRAAQLGDAVRMVGSGYAGADDVDAAMTAGCGYPEGPITVIDRMGPDRVLALLEAVHAETGEPGHAPPALLRQVVAAGRGVRAGPAGA